MSSIKKKHTKKKTVSRSRLGSWRTKISAKKAAKIEENITDQEIIEQNVSKRDANKSSALDKSKKDDVKQGKSSKKKLGEIQEPEKKPKSAKPVKSAKFSVKTRPQHRRRHIIYGVLTAIIGVGLISTAYYFVKWKVEIDITDAEIAEAQSASTVSQVDDALGVETVSTNEDENNPYWYYLQENLINVDFSDLKQTNSETVGWVQVPGTRIDYPFVQTDDNDFYLSHSLDRSGNSAGWVFLDYRNRTNLIGNQNSILYAHGRVDGSMFGTLKNVLDETWLNNADYHIVKTSTISEDALWQVFSVYRTPVTSDYLQTEFESQDEYVNFLNTLQGRSVYAFGANLSRNDHIITLSTCIGSNDRVVLHAKLIKLSRH